MWPLIALALAVTPEPPPRTFALVIGHNVALDEKTPTLRFADDDAVAMHELLGEAGARSVLLVDADAETRALHPSVASATSPTPAAVRAAWERVQREMKDASQAGPVEFILFFSGHGDVSHGEGYLSLAGGPLTRSAVQNMLGESPAARNHVVIDACKAYFAVLGKGAGGRREPYTQPFAGTSTQTERSGFLLSTSSDGDSHEWERYQSGVFSFELRSALRGSADIDGDGIITYRELGGFLQRANAGIVNSKYRPDFLVLPPGGASSALDAPVLRWPEASAALKLDGAASHVYVEAGSGQRLLEVNRATSARVLVRLPPERPLFIRSADEREERVLESTELTSWSSLASAPVSSAKKGALQLALRQLFSQPFDMSAVHAFGVDYELRSREVTATPSTRETLKVASVVTATTALSVGASALAVGVERRNVSASTSQLERAQRNEAIAAANVTMVVADVIGAAALGTWTVLMLTTPKEPTATVNFTVSAGGVSVSGQW